MTYNKITTIRIALDDYKRLARYAERSERSISQTIRWILRQFLEQEVSDEINRNKRGDNQSIDR